MDLICQRIQGDADDEMEVEDERIVDKATRLLEPLLSSGSKDKEVRELKKSAKEITEICSTISYDDDDLKGLLSSIESLTWV